MQVPTSPEKISLRNHENSLERYRTPRKNFALTSDVRDFGEGKKVKKYISNTFYITVMFL